MRPGSAGSVGGSPASRPNQTLQNQEKEPHVAIHTRAQAGGETREQWAHFNSSLAARPSWGSSRTGHTVFLIEALLVGQTEADLGVGV